VDLLPEDLKVDGTGAVDGATLMRLTVMVPPGEGAVLESWGGIGREKSVWVGMGAIVLAV